MSHDFITNYLSWFDFKNMKFIDAFRSFFSSMFIPPKLKAVDFVIFSFAKEYFNVTHSTNSIDDCYFLTLNTFLLHNNIYLFHDKMQESAKNSPKKSYDDVHESGIVVTFEEFKKMNHLFNKGINYDDQLLKSIYDEVCKKQIFPVHQIRQIMTFSQMETIFKYKEVIAKQNIDEQEKFFIANDMVTKKMKRLIFESLIKLSESQAINSTVTHNVSSSLQMLYTYSARSYDHENLKLMNDYFFSHSILKNEKEKENNSLTLMKISINNANYISGVWLKILFEVSTYCKITDDNSYLNKIISSTTAMTRDQIKEFIVSVIEVANWELGEKMPRFTMAMSLLDIIQWNSDRPIYYWIKLWPNIEHFLITHGTSKNIKISQSIIDLTKQIVMQTLNFKQQKNLHCQHIFLAPFISIYDQQKSKQMKELIILNLYSIIKQYSKRLRTGWDIIFQCLTLACMENIEFETCILIAKHIITQKMNYMLPYSVLLMTFVSTIIQISLNADQKISNLRLFSSLGENMKNKLPDPWICLFENLLRYLSSPNNTGEPEQNSINQIMSDEVENIIIHILQFRNDIPQMAVLFFFENIFGRFSKNNLSKLVEVLIDSNEYIGGKCFDVFITKLKQYIDNNNDYRFLINRTSFLKIFENEQLHSNDPIITDDIIEKNSAIDELKQINNESETDNAKLELGGETNFSDILLKNESSDYDEVSDGSNSQLILHKSDNESSHANEKEESDTIKTKDDNIITVSVYDDIIYLTNKFIEMQEKNEIFSVFDELLTLIKDNKTLSREISKLKTDYEEKLKPIQSKLKNLFESKMYDKADNSILEFINTRINSIYDNNEEIKEIINCLNYIASYNIDEMKLVTNKSIKAILQLIRTNNQELKDCLISLLDKLTD